MFHNAFWRSAQSTVLRLVPLHRPNHRKTHCSSRRLIPPRKNHRLRFLKFLRAHLPLLNQSLKIRKIQIIAPGIPLHGPFANDCQNYSQRDRRDQKQQIPQVSILPEHDHAVTPYARSFPPHSSGLSRSRFLPSTILPVMPRSTDWRDRAPFDLR